jgi:hypothetical protein
MARTCATRQIQNKKVVWPYFDRSLYGNKFRGRVIGRADIDEMAELWRATYFELYGSSSAYEWVLHPLEYETKVALKDSWETDCLRKEFCITVAEEIGSGRLASAALYRKDDRNLSVEISLTCIHPEYRSGKKGAALLAPEGLEYIRMIEDQSGAEYMSAFCETWTTATQYIAFKHMGWKIAGIFPGQVTRWCGQQREHRGCLVHLYKLVGDGEKYVTKPEEWQLIPEARKLWTLLEELNKESDDAALRECRKQAGTAIPAAPTVWGKPGLRAPIGKAAPGDQREQLQ